MQTTLHEYFSTFTIIPRSVPHVIRNVSDNHCREKQTHTFYVQSVFFPENHAFYEIIWKNIVQPDRLQIIVWLMHISSWIPKATITQSQYAIHIAFPLQQCLRERAMSCYMYIVYLVLTVEL